MGTGTVMQRWGGGLVALCLMVTSTATAQRFGGEEQAPHYARDRVADVEHIALDVTLDLEVGRIVGTSTITLSLLRASDRLLLDAAEMRIGAVTVNGKTVETTHRQQKLRVALGEEMAVGSRLVVVVPYDATPQRGMYFVRPDRAYPDRTWQVWTQSETEDARYWFPGYDAPDDRLTSEMRVRVRDPLVVISNGALLETSPVDAGYRTFHYKQEAPHVSYLMTLVAGEFRRFEIAGHRIPMAAWVAPRDAQRWARPFESTVEMTHFFEEYIGQPYPWERYDQVAVDEYTMGGMEHTGATTLTSAVVHGERGALDYSAEELVAHELVHQWFGNLITCRTWAHLWLNEGFASYFELLYIGHKYGKEEADLRRVASTSWYAHESYRRRLDENRYEHPDDLFDAHTYMRGAWILHMLRIKLGDALFQKAVRHYAEKHRQTVVETRDLRRAFEEATGASLEAFFDQWVHRAGDPKLTLSWSWDEEGQSARITVLQESEEPYRLSFPIQLTGDFGTRLHPVILDRAEQLIVIPLPSEPRMIEFDPSDDVLAVRQIEKPLWEHLYQLQHGTTALSRQRAARALASFANTAEAEAATEGLRTALASEAENERVKARVARSLAEFKRPEVEESLLSALEDPKARVRRAAASALSGFSGARVHRALRRVFRRDRSYRTAAAALSAYVESNGADRMRLIREGLRRDSFREWIRIAAVRALGSVGGERAFEVALEASEWGHPSQVRRHAAVVLGTLAAADEGLRARALERVISLLEDPSLLVQYGALSALRTLGEPGAVPALEAVLSRDPPHSILKSARRALEASQQSEAPLEQRIQSLEQRVEQLEEE